VTKAQLVREALTAELAKIPGIGATGGKYTSYRQETNLPAIYTISDGDDSVRAQTRSKTVTARFALPIVFRTDDPDVTFDDLRGAAEAQIEDDPSLGGLVNDAWVNGSSGLATCRLNTGDAYVRAIFVTVEYYHDRGAP
jgi:hypothetical protein